MRIYLTKLEIPQFIRTSQGYMVIHLYDDILSIFEFEEYDKAERVYQDAVNFYALQQENKLNVEKTKSNPIFNKDTPSDY